MSIQTPDVQIAGAGIIGLSIAWRLAKAGARVRVMDAHTAGSGASHAAAGMLAPGGEFFHDEPLLHLAQASMKLWPDFVAELRNETGVAIDYVECGAVERPASESEWKQLADRARRQQELGIGCEIWDGELFFPGDCAVDPRDVVRALHRACLMRKVDIRENESVGTVDARGSCMTVISAGCWSGDIRIANGETPAEVPAVTPVKGHLIGYRLAPGTLPHILRSGSTYILQRSDGFTIAGSTTERVGFDTAVDPAICRDIQDRACRLWPALRAWQPAERWTGLRPAAETELPVVGRLASSNVWLAYGHYRNGILLAPVTAELIAAGITASAGKDSSVPSLPVRG